MRASSSVNHLVSRSGKNLKQGTRGQAGHRTNVTHKENGTSIKPEADDVDFEMQLCYNEGFSDENCYMWLSSTGGTSNRQLSDTLEIDLSDIGLLYYQFSGKCPLSRSDWAFFDVDQKNFVSDMFNASDVGASLLFDRTEVCGAEFNGSCSSSEDSPTVDTSWTSIGTWDEPFPLQDTVGVWLPLFDLEGEEPKLDADDLHVGDEDLFDPPCHRRAKSSSFSCGQDFDELLNVQVSLDSSNSVPNLSPEDLLLDVRFLPDDSEADEPLFWPFDQKSYWSTELEWSCLDISPFGCFLNITGSHPSKLFQLRLHRRNNSSLLGRKFQQRCQGRMPTSSQPHLHRSTDPSSGIPNDIGAPSERCRSTRLPPSTATRSLSNNAGGKDLHRSNPLRNKNALHQMTSLEEYILEFEADDFRIYLTGELPIEALLGLDEFDGYEGIGRVTAD